MSSKKEAVLCHQLAALSDLMLDTLSDLNWDSSFSNDFKADLKKVHDRCELLINEVFGAEEVRASNYLSDLANKVGTVVRKNFNPNPQPEVYEKGEGAYKYSIFDKDTGDYLHTGRNSETKGDALTAWVSYKTGAIDGSEFTDQLEQYVKDANWTLLEQELQADNFVLDKHLDLLPEEDFL